MSEQSRTRKTCNPCRSKKMRCDGVHPICGPCSRARGSTACVYPEVPRKPSPAGSLLQKGTACIPCRFKKKKCDGKRPRCTLCEVVGKAEECDYADAQQARTEDLLNRIAELEKRVQTGSPVMDVESWLHLQKLTPPSSGSSLSPESFQPTFEDPLLTDSVSNTEIDMSFLSSFPLFFGTTLATSPSSFVQNLVNPSPDLPLAGTVPNLRALRNCYLFHRVQIGFDVSIRKLTAIRDGDLSSTIIHPILVSLAHVWGCKTGSDDLLPYIADVETTESSAIVSFLADEENVRRDPTLATMVATQFGLYCIVKYYEEGHGPVGPAFIGQACRIVNEYRLRAVPSSGMFETANNWGLPTPAATLSAVADDDAASVSAMPHIETWMLDADEMQEHNGVLYQLFYLDIQRRLDGAPHWEIDRETCVHLEGALSYVQGMPSLRSKTIHTVFKARTLIRIHALLSKGSPTTMTSEQWFTRFWNVLNETTQVLQNLRHCLLRCAFYGKNMLVITLRSCLAIANTAFMELQRLMLKLHADSRRAALAAADEIIDSLLAVPETDYFYLDPFLVHCCMSVSDVLADIESFIGPVDTFRMSSFAERHDQLGKIQRALLRKFYFLTKGSGAAARAKYRMVDEVRPGGIASTESLTDYWES